MAESLVITGARARFMINGQKVGYARNVSVGEMLRYDPVEVLDNIEVQEHVPVAYTVQLRVGKFRLLGDTMKSLGYFPKTGGSSTEHLSNVLTSGVMTAAIQDSKTGANLATIEGVRVASTNWNVDARGVVGEDVDFVAIRSKDESEV
jgi:hypothetical protein